MEREYKFKKNTAIEFLKWCEIILTEEEVEEMYREIDEEIEDRKLGGYFICQIGQI